MWWKCLMRLDSEVSCVFAIMEGAGKHGEGNEEEGGDGDGGGEPEWV
jgi:hypothetical protein